MSKIVRSATVFIQVDLEKDMSDEFIAGEICRRISMHPDVHDANWLNFGLDTNNVLIDKDEEGYQPVGFWQKVWNRVKPA